MYRVARFFEDICMTLLKDACHVRREKNGIILSLFLTHGLNESAVGISRCLGTRSETFTYRRSLSIFHVVLLMADFRGFSVMGGGVD